MIYASIDDLKNFKTEAELAQLTNDNYQSQGIISEPVLLEIIEKESQFIDAYIGIRYQLPLSNPHSILTKICIDLVVWSLYNRVSQVDDKLSIQKATAIGLLKEIKSGLITLEGEVVKTSGKLVEFSTKAPVFDKYFKGYMDGY